MAAAGSVEEAEAEMKMEATTWGRNILTPRWQLGGLQGASPVSSGDIPLEGLCRPKKFSVGNVP